MDSKGTILERAQRAQARLNGLSAERRNLKDNLALTLIQRIITRQTEGIGSQKNVPVIRGKGSANRAVSVNIV